MNNQTDGAKGAYSVGNTYNMKNPELSPKGKKIFFWMTVGMAFVCSAALPFLMNVAVAITVALLCAVYLFVTAEKKISMLAVLIFLFGVFGISPLSAGILLLAVGIGCFAHLITETLSPYVAIIPFAAYSIITILTGNWFVSLLVFACALPGFILSMTLIAQSGRISSICATCASMVGFILAGVFLGLLYYLGEIRLDVVSDFFDELKNSISTVVSELDVALLNGNTESIFSFDDAYNIAAELIALTPAIVIVLCNTISYFAQRLQFVLLRRFGKNDLLSSKSLAFILSPLSGVTFILSFLILTIVGTSASEASAATVCNNIFLILIPGLTGMGILYHLAKRAQNRTILGLIGTIILIGLAFFNLPLAIMFAACLGAYASIAIPFYTFMKSRVGKD